MSTTTTPVTTTPSAIDKASARVARAVEAANKAKQRAIDAQAKAEERLRNAGGKDERMAEAKRIIHEVIATEAARRVCLCGCGQPTPRAFFQPGHDARLLSVTLKELAAEAK